MHRGLLINNMNSDLHEMMRFDRVDVSASPMNTVLELVNSKVEPGRGRELAGGN